MSTKVLVFESDASFAGELRNELGKLGCATTVVDDGNAGLQQAAGDKPDLILLSIELPRMNGFSVCNKLKKDASLKDVPLIIMSSESSDETFEQHRKLRTRAEDYVRKPIAFGELLRHIQALVELDVVPSRAEPIVVDDVIDLGAFDEEDEDKTQFAVRPKISPAKKVDPDVDAFADAAFARLGEPAARENNGAKDSTTSPAATKIREALGTNEEHERALARDRELAEARAETEKLRAEIEQLRKKPSQSPKGGSGREFLDLREALNKKDKETLALKEQLSKKSREAIEAQDKLLGLERGKSDMDDTLLGIERQLEEAREQNEALRADRDAAKKTGDDAKARLEKAKFEIENKDKALAEAKEKAGQQVAAHEAKIAALRSELDQTLANERAEHAKALDQAEQTRKADLEAAKRDKDAAVAEAREGAEKRLQEEHSAAIERARKEAEARNEALQRDRDEAVGAIRRDKDEAIETLEREKSAALAGLRGELENDRDAKVAALEARIGREVSEATERAAKLEADLAAARAKWNADKQALERAKDALAVALQQIEDAESRSL